MLVSATGSGKTPVIAYLAGKTAEANKKVLILAHRIELVRQASETLDDLGIKHGLIISGCKEIPKENVVVGMINTVYNRKDKINEPYIILCDEAAHCVSKNVYGKILLHFKQSIVVGFSATPLRLDGKGFNDIFEDIIIGKDTSDLIDMGFLTPFDIYAPKELPDTKGLHKLGGDYKIEEIDSLMNRPTVTGNAVIQYRQLADNKRAIVFCCSIKHAESVRNDFIAAGYKFELITSNMDHTNRKKVVEDLANGTIHGLVSVDIISEGFNIPAVDVAILLRPTASLALYLQQVGRVLRKFPGKDKAIIIDAAGNVFKHGMPDEKREWSLSGEQVRKRKLSDSPALNIRTCPKCLCVHKNNTDICPRCGHEYEIKSRLPLKKDGDLEKIESVSVKKAEKKELWKLKSLAELQAYGAKMGYKPGWAYFIWKGRKWK